MAKFTQGKWEADEAGNIYADKLAIAETRGLAGVFKGDTKLLIARTEGLTYLRNVLGYSLEDGLAEIDANARLIAAAPEMYTLLKEELIPISDYGGILSFAREAKVKALIARIDSTEVQG